VVLAPEDNDPAALRYALWNATDEAYKGALGGYAAKQAALKRFEKAPTAEDFAHAVAVQKVEPLVSLTMDEAGWKKRIAEASGLFLTDPKLAVALAHVQYSNASVRGLAVNRYLVNTEGTVVRHGYTGYGASYSVGGQADDGMRLGRDNGTTAADRCCFPAMRVRM
jgi:predicted Zn-dependent protease